MRNNNFPMEVKEHFLKVLQEEREFVGEKKIERGFLIKRNRDRATMIYDNGSVIYAAKFVYSSNEWKVVGGVSVWDNIKDLLELN